MRAGVPCAPPLRRVTFRRQRGLATGAKAPGGAPGTPGRREAGVPREEAPGRKTRGRGRGSGELRGPAANPALRAKGDGGSGGAAFPFPQENDPASPGRAGPERPREPRRWRDFALRSERRADLYPARERVRAPPGDCSVWRAELLNGPRGRGAGKHSSETGRRGGCGRGQRHLPQPPAWPPAVPPFHSACPRPTRAVAEPCPPALVPCVLPASLTALFTGTASPSATPRPLRRAGWLCSPDPEPRGLSLGRARLVSSAPEYPCAVRETSLGR